MVRFYILNCQKKCLDKGAHHIFVLPGCGAFGNPVETTARIFLTALHAQIPSLNQHGISFCIVELNENTHNTMLRIAKEMNIVDNYGAIIPPPQTVPLNPPLGHSTGSANVVASGVVDHRGDPTLQQQ
jgi:hypothetical protein